jgi:Tfp pilus assembly protein FimT
MYPRHHPPICRRRVPQHRRGYSLIEVLMTTLIIQMIAGMVSVSVSNVAATERANYAGQEAITAIRYARQLAQSDGTPCGVIFDAANQQIRVFRGTPSTTAVNSAIPGGQYIIKLAQQANTTGVKITSVSLAGPPQNNVVTYGNIGAISGTAKGLGSTVNTGFVVLSNGEGTTKVWIPAAGEPTLN